MFKSRIRELGRDKGLENAFQLSKALRCSPTKATRLWNGDFSKIGIDTLHSLCELFECQISDFLYFVTNDRH